MFLKRTPFILIISFLFSFGLSADRWKNRQSVPVSHACVFGAIVGSGSGGNGSGFTFQVNKSPQVVRSHGRSQSVNAPVNSSTSQASTVQEQQINDSFSEALSNEYVQRALREDPLWEKSNYEAKQDSNFQRALIVRLDHLNRLKELLDIGNDCPPQVQDFLYDIVGKADLAFFYKAIEEANRSGGTCGTFERAVGRARNGLLVKFAEKLASNFEGYPQSVKDYFIHPSGFLRSILEDPYAQKHFLHQGIENDGLLRGVNYASLFKNATHPGLYSRACESLRCAEQLLDFYDTDIEDDIVEEYYWKRLSEATTGILAGEKSTQFYPELNDELIETFHELEINQVHEGRVEAFEQAKKEGFVDHKKSYNIAPEVKGFMEAFNINKKIFKELVGNKLQHHLTGEMFGIMHKSVGYSFEIAKHIADFIDLAQSLNQSKKLEQAMTSTDICYGLSDYAEAVKLGFMDSASGLVNLAAHPAQHIYDIGAGVCALIKNMGTYFYNREFNPPAARESEDATKKALLGLMEVAMDSTGPERVRVGAQLFTDHVLTGRALSAVSRLTVSSATIFADVAEIPFLNLVEKISEKKEYLQTSVGRVAAHYFEEGKAVAGQIKESAIKAFKIVRETMPCLKKIRAEVALITKELGVTTTKLFGSHMEVIIDFEHVFLPSFPYKLSMKNLRINGWHHDFKNYIEKFKGVKLLNKEYRTNCLIADIDWAGKKLFRKTFFPTDWTRKKVALKIREAFKGAKLFKNEKGFFYAKGVTSEGIVIRFNLDQIGNKIKIKSAFPCEKWLLGIV